MQTEGRERLWAEVSAGTEEYGACSDPGLGLEGHMSDPYS